MSVPCRLQSTFLLLLASLLPPVPAAAKLEQFELDPVHTRVAFQVSHAGFSNPVGTFSGTTGTLSFDEDDWSTAQLTVRVPIATLDLGDANWQKKILDPTFFNSAKFPEASFVSTASREDRRQLRASDRRAHAARRDPPRDPGGDAQRAQAASADVQADRRLLGHRHAQSQGFRNGRMVVPGRRRSAPDHRGGSCARQHATPTRQEPDDANPK